MKSSIGIATSVSYLPVPREPSSSDTRGTGKYLTLTAIPIDDFIGAI